MLQSRVGGAAKPHGLSSLAERHVGRSGIHYETCAARESTVQPGRRYRPNIPAKTPTTLDVHRVLWPQLQAKKTVYL
jgi:DNA polymerase-1